jgi:hypothetical protein
MISRIATYPLPGGDTYFSASGGIPGVLPLPEARGAVTLLALPE